MKRGKEKMDWPRFTQVRAAAGLLLVLSTVCHGLSLPEPSRIRLPWGDGIPTPESAELVPPIDWSSISPPFYIPSVANGPGHAAKLTADGNLSIPTLVDWRDRNGMNYITTPQDQGVCQACWAFAVTALVESMIRIEHGHWAKRSEADVHDAVGAACESVGNAQDTLAFFAGAGSAFINSTATSPPGIADWVCEPYEATPHGYSPCADRSGRTTRIPMYQQLGTAQDQKRWLAEYGPVVATFQLYSDLASWKKTDETPVYRVSNGSTTSGNHIALVVGYDDDQNAWIMKNSWGPSWGDKGFVYFAYGEANIDGWTKYGITNVDPDPWSRKRHQSGSMMQSGNGPTHRNFELLLATNGSDAGGFAHVEREGSSGKWKLVSRVGKGVAPVGQPVVVGTSVDRDFAAVFVDESKNLQQWSYTQVNRTWARVSAMEGRDIDGYPGMAQDDDSALVMVVRHADGTLNEYRQPLLSQTWTLSARIADNITQSGPSLVVSSVGQNIYSTSSRGDAYVVAVRPDGRLQLFSRPGNGTSWSTGEVFGSGVGDTPPVMIQDFFNTRNETSAGGLQLVVAVNGGFQQWRRDIESSDGRWEMVEAVGTGVRHVWGLVQGSFGGKMHMVTEGTDRRISYWEWDGTWKVVQTLKALGDKSWEGDGEVDGG